MFLFIYIFIFLWKYLLKNRLFNYVYDTWLFFYGFLVLFNSACKLCQLSKLALTSYLQIVYIFILGSFFLKEEIFFTDIIGSFFIVGFMIYNTMNPLPVK